jgi:ribonuclease P protein component
VATDFRFGAEFRLHTPAEYAAVFAQRQVRRGRLFHLHYRAAIGKGPRLGLVIPKKHARSAVLRNLFKRIAREAFRSVHNGLPPVDLVLRLAKPVVVRADHDGSGRHVWRSEIDVLLAQLAQLPK